MGDKTVTLDALVVAASRSLMDSQGHPPTVIVETERQVWPMFIGGPVPDNHADRQKMMFAIGKAFTANHGIPHDIQQVFFVAEAWMKTGPEGAELKDIQAMQEREEVLMITCVDITNDTRTLVTLDIIRNEDDEIVGAKKRHDVKGEASLTTIRTPLVDAFLLGCFDQGGEAWDAQ